MRNRKSIEDFCDPELIHPIIEAMLFQLSKDDNELTSWIYQALAKFIERIYPSITQEYLEQIFFVCQADLVSESADKIEAEYTFVDWFQKQNVGLEGRILLFLIK